MSDLILNIRFGSRHFQIDKEWKCSFRFNMFWLTHRPDKWFCIYQIGNMHWN